MLMMILFWQRITLIFIIINQKQIMFTKTEKVQWKLWVYFSTPFYHLLRIEFQLSLLSHYWLIDWILSRFGSFSGIVTRLLYHRMFTWSSTINYTWIGPNQIAKGLALFTSRQSNLELLGSILGRFMHASLFSFHLISFTFRI